MPADNTWLTHAGTLALLAIVPFFVIACTCFAKVAVVLGFVRSALGAPGVPPAMVLTGLAVVMTVFIMAPVTQQMMEEARWPDAPDGTDQKAVFADAMALYESASPPLLNFLSRNTPKEEIAFFNKLAGEKEGAKPATRVLLIAFASAELMEALAMGVLLLIPFLLVDLLVGHTLLALGMANLPALAVALPLKLILFIAADGWHLLVRALVVSYGGP